MFTHQYRAFFIAIVVTLIGHPVSADDTNDTIDDVLLAKLQGEWSPISTVFDGKPFKSPLANATFVFEGRTMSIRLGDKVAGSAEIKHLVAKEDLGYIDYEVRDPAGKTIRTKQLFKLDGDMLTTCIRSPPGDRPSEFTSKPGSKHLLTVSQRKKKEQGKSDRSGEIPPPDGAHK